MFWVTKKEIKEKLDALEEAINVLIAIQIAPIKDDIRRLEEENKRLRGVSEYWRNRACHKKTKNNRKAVLEKARQMDQEGRKK